MFKSDIEFLAVSFEISEEEVMNVIEKVKRIQFLKWYNPENKNKKVIKEGNIEVYECDKSRCDVRGIAIPEKVLEPNYTVVRRMLEKSKYNI